MPTTVPKKVTGQIRRLCERIRSGAEPVFVPVRTHPSVHPHDCFLAVRAAVEHAGGSVAFGWGIWIWFGVMVEAEHHACWELPDGTLVDITPKPDGGKRQPIPAA